MKRVILILVCAWLVGCGPSSHAGSCPGAAEGAAGGEQVPAPTRDAVVGTWAEYWSVAGKAATSQYVFGADGTWSWHAVPESEPTVAERAGRWELVDGVLVLTATAQEERAGCVPPCETAAPRRVELNPPVVERLPIGACPPNDEARKLDASYTCISLGDRAYWRR